MGFEIKDIPAITFLSATVRLADVPEIAPYAQKTVPALFAKSKELGLEIAGPEVFIYHFLEKGMDVRIGVPVKAARGEPAPFAFHTTQPVKCFSTVYAGSMKTIGTGWDKLTYEGKARKLALTNECREVYTLWKDFDSADNRTELQRVMKA